jgi:hypothetical protein
LDGRFCGILDYQIPNHFKNYTAFSTKVLQLLHKNPLAAVDHLITRSQLTAHTNAAKVGDLQETYDRHSHAQSQQTTTICHEIGRTVKFGAL